MPDRNTAGCCDGRAEDLAPAHERMRLFDAPRTMKGQLPMCSCPDDCNCRHHWRPNYCGCRAHSGEES